METKVLNYRIIVEPDKYPDTDKRCYTAYSPTLGVADYGDTIEEALENIQKGITLYIEALAEELFAQKICFVPF